MFVGLGVGQRGAPVRRFTPPILANYLTRATAAWHVNPSTGILTQYAANVARLVTSPAGLPSILRELQSTNKCANYNANPNQAIGTTATTAGSSITGMSVVADAGSVLSIVDDSAALGAAGLSGVCTSGKAYKFDTTGASVASYVLIAGDPGNTNQHAQSLYLRRTTGAGIRLGFPTAASPVVDGGGAVSAAYARISAAASGGTVTLVPPPATAQPMIVWAIPGVVLYFVLNQFEEQSGVTAPIVTAGSAVTRSRDEINIPTVVSAGAAFSEMIDFAASWMPAANARLIGSGLSTSDAFFGTTVSPFTVGDYNGANATTTVNAVAAGARGKFARSADGAGRSLCLNAGAVSTNAFTFPAVANRLLGQESIGNDVRAPVLYIHEYRQAFRRWSSSQLQQVTA